MQTDALARLRQISQDLIVPLKIVPGSAESGRPQMDIVVRTLGVERYARAFTTPEAAGKVPPLTAEESYYQLPFPQLAPTLAAQNIGLVLDEGSPNQCFFPADAIAAYLKTGAQGMMQIKNCDHTEGFDQFAVEVAKRYPSITKQFLAMTLNDQGEVGILLAVAFDDSVTPEQLAEVRDLALGFGTTMMGDTGLKFDFAPTAPGDLIWQAVQEGILKPLYVRE